MTDHKERLIQSFMTEQSLTREEAEKAYEAFEARMACSTGNCED